jgi:hypothetical protein
VQASLAHVSLAEATAETTSPPGNRRRRCLRWRARVSACCGRTPAAAGGKSLWPTTASCTAR